MAKATHSFITPSLFFLSIRPGLAVGAQVRGWAAGGSRSLGVQSQLLELELGEFLSMSGPQFPRACLLGSWRGRSRMGGSGASTAHGGLGAVTMGGPTWRVRARAQRRAWPCRSGPGPLPTSPGSLSVGPLGPSPQAVLPLGSGPGLGHTCPSCLWSLLSPPSSLSEGSPPTPF